MMKPALFLTTALLTAGTAQADVLGLTAEAGYFLPSADSSSIDGTSANLDGNNGAYFGIAFEHPLPVVPNIRFQSIDLSANSSSQKLDLSHQDYTLYYELLDGLLWIDLDVGLTVRKFSGSVRTSGHSRDISSVYPLGYASGYITIPGTRVSLGGELKAGGFDGATIADTTLKIKYQTPFLVGVEGGYRRANIDLDDKDVKSTFSGAFVGAFIDF